MGMVIAAYAIGSRHGIVYLRAEYAYLKRYLERQLQQLRDDGLLGCSVGGRPGFDFDIRIQMGAGSYVCGEESALIESCEGKRGTPRLKPPFPVQEGYLGKPTCVNNVETFAAATRVVEEGAEWFRRMGTPDSAGTRLLSVAGDCDRPGVYEVEWGITLDEVLTMVGAHDARAVQISGPSGECLSVEADGRRRIAYEDIPCNGAVTIFNSTRDLLDCVKDYTKFFADESCGICVPCRAGTVDLHNKVELILAGTGTQKDVDDAASWGALVRTASRCGLGATAANPLLTTLEKFPEIYRSRLRTQEGALRLSFDLDAALAGYDKAVTELETDGTA
jgi:[NiFe] hydrogenase diaphorase moiety large subunit